MVEWEYAIVEAINDLGGSGTLQELYQALRQREPLTPRHRQPQWDHRPAYQHQTRSHVSNLVQKGELVRVARGRYALTEQGKSRVG